MPGAAHLQYIPVPGRPSHLRRLPQQDDNTGQLSNMQDPIPCPTHQEQNSGAGILV